MTIAFVVPGSPLSQNRAYRRSIQRRMYKSDEAYAYTARLIIAAREARNGRAMLTGPVAVSLRVVFDSDRPDLDGPVKLVLDALQEPRARRPGAGLYANDRQVRRLVVERLVDRFDPRLEVVVEPLALGWPPP